ncbi:hypothetical protein SAPIO_CDS0418 [Scedosporium apiospermum]|uniref:Uncharacterized protein n=1 Tax=Pseudallescheria apiosperma TaxID=563466 RepID=A0A084GGZ0_PSEDA|nr:uncharacterized protein SAPIO_CDS0418 [Scedosporium apiospermum]KEZ46602.1 hypothetical protein SAPIO_CDS0418 [Scedosporium apiospermum]
MLARLSLVLSALTIGSLATSTLDKVLTRSEVDLGALAPVTVDDGVSLQWSGSIFPGEEPTFLYGDIEEIYKAILSVNPDYQAAEASPESWETFGVHTGTSLEKRQNGYSCAVMATGSFDLNVRFRLASPSFSAPRSKQCRLLTPYPMGD